MTTTRAWTSMRDPAVAGILGPPASHKTELNRILDKVVGTDKTLGEVTFQAPVSHEDCAEVGKRLRALVPKGTKLDIFHLKQEFVQITLSLDNESPVSRRITIKAKP